jgi:hypothetical protein
MDIPNWMWIGQTAIAMTHTLMTMNSQSIPAAQRERGRAFCALRLDNDHGVAGGPQ